MRMHKLRDVIFFPSHVRYICYSRYNAFHLIMVFNYSSHGYYKTQNDHSLWQLAVSVIFRWLLNHKNWIVAWMNLRRILLVWKFVNSVNTLEFQLQDIAYGLRLQWMEKNEIPKRINNICIGFTNIIMIKSALNCNEGRATKNSFRFFFYILYQWSHKKCEWIWHVKDKKWFKKESISFPTDEGHSRQCHVYAYIYLYTYIRMESA